MSTNVISIVRAIATLAIGNEDALIITTNTLIAEGPLTRSLRFAPASTSPRIRLRQKAGFGGQERGEV